MRRDEIVKALRCFASEDNCPFDECNEKCPYWMEIDKYDIDNPNAEISDVHQLCCAAADLLEQDVPPTDMVPKDFHDRCMEMEIGRRMLLEQNAPKWISVKERMPESGEKVIARLQSKTFQRYRPITMLAHIGAHEKTTDDSDWRDCECDTEYDEKNDCYWIPECWYEVNVVDDNPNWIVGSDYNVTHWMPLPTFPTEKEEAK